MNKNIVELIGMSVAFLAVIFVADWRCRERDPHYLECSRIGRANVQAVAPAPQNTDANYSIAGVFTNVWDCVLFPPEQMGQIMWDTKNDRPFTGMKMDRGEPLEFKDGFPVAPIKHIQTVLGHNLDRPFPFFGTITNGNTVLTIYDGRIIEIGELK